MRLITLIFWDVTVFYGHKVSRGHMERLSPFLMSCSFSQTCISMICWEEICLAEKWFLVGVIAVPQYSLMTSRSQSNIKLSTFLTLHSNDSVDDQYRLVLPRQATNIFKKVYVYTQFKNRSRKKKIHLLLFFIMNVFLLLLQSPFFSSFLPFFTFEWMCLIAIPGFCIKMPTSTWA